MYAFVQDRRTKRYVNDRNQRRQLLAVTNIGVDDFVISKGTVQIDDKTLSKSCKLVLSG